MMSKLVEMKNIKKTYNGKHYVLSNIDFSIDKGEISTIFGASGCGKSTFLNIVGLLDNFTEGEYVFNGKQVNPKKLNSYHLQRSLDIGFVFQSYCLIESISVKDNILMPFLYNNISYTKNIHNNLNTILEQFNLIELINKKVSLLSGGERQRVAIARAMIKSPKLIIADEPTGNLDDKNAKLVVEAFKRISSQGTSIIVVTHNEHLSFNASATYNLEEGVLHLC